MSSSNSNIYSALPFSYLTGGAPDKKKPSLSELNSVPTSTPEEAPEDVHSMTHVGHANDGFMGDSMSNLDTASRPGRRSRENRVSLDVTDPTKDVAIDPVDPYLLSTGALTSGSKVGTHLTEGRDSIESDGRYRDSVPSSSDGDNVFFRPQSGSDSGYPSTSGKQKGARTRGAAFTNPNIELVAADDSKAKLPRLRVEEDGIYSYYKGREGDPDKANPDFNPIWEKYYAGSGLPSADKLPKTEAGYPPRSPASPGIIRPSNKEEDFRTLLRTSGTAELYGLDVKDRPRCCGCVSKTAAVVITVVVTAVICLGAGFAAGWFIFQLVNNSPAVADNMTSSTSTPSTTVSATTTTILAPVTTTTTTTTTPTTPSTTPSPTPPPSNTTVAQTAGS